MPALERVHLVDDLRQRLQGFRRSGAPIALVPTMGNLHDGHIALVETARQHCDKVVVSIFVNPTQFGAGEDFAEYPRTVERDCEKLQATGADLVFLPDSETMYPGGKNRGNTQIVTSGLSSILCGAHRPGHFDGVTTIVGKLFNLVQPDVAVFGQKDYQQLAIIRQMVRELNFPVKIVGVPIIREQNGLAMSSRNHFLTDAQRALAAEIRATLGWVSEQLLAGERDYVTQQEKAAKSLSEKGFELQYLEIRQPDLSLPLVTSNSWVILLAVKLGSTRLIDNLLVGVDVT